jgi:hypothetical protein
MGAWMGAIVSHEAFAQPRPWMVSLGRQSLHTRVPVPQGAQVLLCHKLPSNLHLPYYQIVPISKHHVPAIKIDTHESPHKVMII